jgi:hypothetical protein
MSQKNFRALILLYVALIVASGIAAFLPGGYSQALSDALDNEPTPPILANLWLMLGVIVPFALAALAGMYGLYMFKQWGRLLSLCSTLAGLVLFPFFGPSLYSGLESALFEASTMLWGAILALSYYSAVNSSFSASNALQATREDARA